MTGYGSRTIGLGLEGRAEYEGRQASGLQHLECIDSGRRERSIQLALFEPVSSPVSCNEVNHTQTYLTCMVRELLYPRLNPVSHARNINVT